MAFQRYCNVCFGMMIIFILNSLVADGCSTHGLLPSVILGRHRAYYHYYLIARSLLLHADTPTSSSGIFYSQWSKTLSTFHWISFSFQSTYTLQITTDSSPFLSTNFLIIFPSSKGLLSLHRNFSNEIRL